MTQVQKLPRELKVPVRGKKHFTVMGGPSVEARQYSIHTTEGMEIVYHGPVFFVKMAKEVNVPCDVSIPTLDYNVPQIEQLDAGLYEAVKHLVQGYPIYVGCYAGKGRTGLFMSVLCKAFGVEKPVEYVRENYYPHAVETTEQYQFVTDYAIPPAVKKLIRNAKFWSYFSLFNDNLTKYTIDKA